MTVVPCHLNLGSALLLACALVAGTAFTEDKPAPVKAVYDESGNGHQQFAHALAQAKKESKMVLVQYGGNWCGWCIRLHQTFEGNPDLKAILSERFVLLFMDTHSNQELVKAQLPEISGVPHLAVYDGDGNLLASQGTEVFEQGNGHDPAKLRAWLEERANDKPTAPELLERALKRAREQNKRVFLAFGSPSCGWCRRLEEFVHAKPAAETLGKDYEFLKIDLDTMKNAKVVLLRYVPGAATGIPWFAVLNEDGTPLITSDAPNSGNIGYPVKEEEQRHFMAMLEKGAQHTTPEQRTAVAKALETRAAEIRARMAQ